MTAPTKTDNHDPSAKLCLRHYFLRKYHADGLARVLDCCMGSGYLWRELRKTHKTDSYLGLDVKPKKGRLKIDSARYLEAGGWDHDCIDVDTYGQPWKHWAQILPRVSVPITVFLTIGKGAGEVSVLSGEALRAMGLSGFTVPHAIQGRLWEYAERYCLADAERYGVIIEEAIEATSDGNARYLGVRLVPKKDQKDQTLC